MVDPVFPVQTVTVVSLTGRAPRDVEKEAAKLPVFRVRQTVSVPVEA